MDELASDEGQRMEFDKCVYHVIGGKVPPEQETVTPLEEIDGNIDKVRLLDATPDDGYSFRENSLKAGRPIDGTHMPTTYRRTGDPKYPLLDVEFPFGLFTACEKFKQIVEHFEPGVHQFFPVTIKRQGKVLGEYYQMVICNRLDVLSREYTLPPLLLNGKHRPDLENAENNRLVYDLKRLGNRHVWYNSNVIGSSSYNMFSAEIVAALQGANLSGLSFNPVPAV